MAHLGDLSYINGVKNGDSRVLEEIYQEYSGSVKSWILKNNGSYEDAQDIFQDALVAIYKKTLDPDFQLRSPFGPLLISICKNKWIDQLRKKSRNPEVRNIEEERLVDEAVDNNDLEAIEETSIREKKLERSFVQLSDLCQQLLKLAMEDTSPSVIAERLGMSGANAVYRRKKACTDRWRILYQELNL